MFEIYEEKQTRMARAFKLVEPATHWKDPIDACFTPRQLIENAVTLNDVYESVIHFTGTVPTITLVFPAVKDSPGYSVKAIGYRAGPCGDH